MFENRAFNKAMSSLKKAEDELAHQRKRANDMDSAIEEAQSRVQFLTNRIDELNGEDGDFRELQSVVDEIIAERDGHAKRMKEYQAFRRDMH